MVIYEATPETSDAMTRLGVMEGGRNGNVHAPLTRETNGRRGRDGSAAVGVASWRCSAAWRAEAGARGSRLGSRPWRDGGADPSARVLGRVGALAAREKVERGERSGERERGWEREKREERGK
jgi:hypothetical protein